VVIYKGHYAPAYSAFEGVTDDGETLAAWLQARGVDALDVCGIATDYCVRATALDAVRKGFDTTVLLDLTAAVAPQRIPEVSAELSEAGVAIDESSGGRS
jgi:nicotinamidase/pyrazinamidase